MSPGWDRARSAAWFSCIALGLGACGGGSGGGSAPPPTIAFSANPTTIDHGSSAQLNWTTTNATSCTASGGWSGAQSINGTASTGALTATATFTLACSGNGGSTQSSAAVTVRPATVTIGGNIVYERVPHGFNGLNYLGLGFVTLNASILIEALDATTLNVLASGRFAASYQLTVPGQRSVVLRATAEMSRQAPNPLPHWQIAVRDLDANGAPLAAVYSYTGPTFDSSSGATRDLQIPSGLNNLGQLVGARDAAPFAILDSIQAAVSRVLAVESAADFPALTIDWSPTNLGGETFFTRTIAGRRVVLAGEVNVDTDEYDPHVIAHEFGHYVDDAFSRSDSVGGPHALGDRLDMRVAYGEGLATAFAAIALGDPVYRDSFGANQANAGFFNIENDQTMAEGWYSESSTQEILWDLFDSVNDGSDTLSAGFQQIWEAMRTPVRQTDAATSLFPFLTAYKQLRPGDTAAINTLVAGEQIESATLNAYGSTETNNAGGSADVLPIYTNIALGGTAQLRSTNAFGTSNKLSSHRFLRLVLAAPTNVRFQASAAVGKDPDLLIFRRGSWLGPAQGPANEDFTLALPAGDYVLDVYDCGNADCNPDVTPGPTDITITVTPN